MMAALDAARDAARGHEAVCVSHQLPIWIVRSVRRAAAAVARPAQAAVHPGRLTSFTYQGDKIVSVGYSEPALDLVPVHLRAGAKPVKGEEQGLRRVAAVRRTARSPVKSASSRGSAAWRLNAASVPVGSA